MKSWLHVYTGTFNKQSWFLEIVSNCIIWYSLLPHYWEHNNSNKLQQYHILNCLVTDRDILLRTIYKAIHYHDHIKWSLSWFHKYFVYTKVMQLQEMHYYFITEFHKQKKGNLQHGLYCLLACVRGLKDGSEFQQLPECLHNVSNPLDQNQWASTVNIYWDLECSESSKYWHKGKTNLDERNFCSKSI